MHLPVRLQRHQRPDVPLRRFIVLALQRDPGGELPVGPDTVVLYEKKTGIEPAAIPLEVKPAIVLAVPMSELAMKSAGTLQAKNNVVLGLLAGWFGLAREAILEGIRRKFSKKGAEILQGNERAYAAGLEYADQHPLARDFRLSTRRLPPLATGGERRKSRASGCWSAYSRPAA